MVQVPLIVIGSSRKSSDTRKTVDEIFKNSEHEIIDLLNHKVSHFNYEKKYAEDDEFIALAEIILAHKVVVFATPVYWYSMSGLMKVFFDRFTDLITVRKDLGKQLRGKTIFLIAVGSSKNLPSGFETPFKETALYLGMNFGSAFYFSSEEDFSQVESASAEFLNKTKLISQ